VLCCEPARAGTALCGCCICTAQEAQSEAEFKAYAAEINMGLPLKGLSLPLEGKRRLVVREEDMEGKQGCPLEVQGGERRATRSAAPPPARLWRCRDRAAGREAPGGCSAQSHINTFRLAFHCWARPFLGLATVDTGPCC
jgi:hypothetical protein